MKPSEILRGFIAQAREEIQDDADLFPREIPMLKRLIRAIEAKDDAELAKNVAQLKTEVDALSWPIPTILPSLVDMIADELAGKKSTTQCPKCGGMIPVVKMEHRLLGR